MKILLSFLISGVFLYLGYRFFKKAETPQEKFNCSLFYFVGLLFLLGGIVLIVEDDDVDDYYYYEYNSGSSNPSFKGSSSNYTRTNRTVGIVSESGVNHGDFYVYLHDGNDYIKFNGEYVKIQGKQRFIYTGVSYTIRR